MARGIIAVGAVSLAFVLGTAFAQDTTSDSSRPGGAANSRVATVDDSNDDGFDYGLLGLAGLAGLAGLMPRDRRDRNDVAGRAPAR